MLILGLLKVRFLGCAAFVSPADWIDQLALFWGRHVRIAGYARQIADCISGENVLNTQHISWGLICLRFPSYAKTQLPPPNPCQGAILIRSRQAWQLPGSADALVGSVSGAITLCRRGRRRSCDHDYIHSNQ